jgi:hypothetical protein
MITYCRPIDFTVISPPLAALLPYSLAARIQARQNLDRLLGIECLADGGVAGCLVVDYFDILNKGKILAWEAAEGFQNQQVYSQLLHGLKKLFPAEEKTTLDYFFPSDSPFKQWLQDWGWSAPLLFLKRYTFDGFRFSPPWLEKGIPALPKGMAITPWKNLTQKRIDALLRQEREHTFEISVSPFGQEEILEPLNSLALIHEEEVIGWCITHRVGPQTIQYSALYIAKEWRFKGAAMTLLAASIRLQKQSTVQWAVLEINLHEIEHSWRKFASLRLEPYADKVENILAASITI